MIKVCFICLGNICRSPMAEIIFCDMVKQAGLTDRIGAYSRATDWYEAGNPVYPPARRELEKHGLSAAGKRSIQLSATDRADYFLCMDRQNLQDATRILGKSDGVSLLMSFCGRAEEVADPWYTGDFAGVYRQISQGCSALLEYLRQRV